MQIGEDRFRVIPSWFECHHRPGCPRRVDEVKGRAEQARQGVIEGYPTRKRPVQLSASLDPDLCGLAHSSSVLASIQAHSSTPVPPSLVPFHGRAPQLSASHLPVLNLR